MAFLVLKKDLKDLVIEYMNAVDKLRVFDALDIKDMKKLITIPASYIGSILEHKEKTFKKERDVLVKGGGFILKDNDGRLSYNLRHIPILSPQRKIITKCKFCNEWIYLDIKNKKSSYHDRRIKAITYTPPHSKHTVSCLCECRVPEGSTTKEEYTESCWISTEL